MSISLKNVLSKPCCTENFNLWLKQCLKCSLSASSLNLAMKPLRTPAFTEVLLTLKFANLSI